MSSRSCIDRDRGDSSVDAPYRVADRRRGHQPKNCRVRWHHERQTGQENRDCKCVFHCVWLRLVRPPKQRDRLWGVRDVVNRCRSIDERGVAQPMPRPFAKSGHAAIESVEITVK